MANRLHGKGGGVTFASGYAMHVKAWDCDRAAEQADGSEMGMVNRMNDAGLMSATGSYTCFVDDATSIADAGTKGTATFKLSVTKTITAKIVITGFTTSPNLDGDIEVQYKWALSGDGSATDFVIA